MAQYKNLMLFLCSLVFLVLTNSYGMQDIETKNFNNEDKIEVNKGLDLSKKLFDNDLCHRLRSGNTSKLQGVSVTKQHLYIVEQDVVYRMPLHQHIDWNKRKIALFDRSDKLHPSDERFEQLGLWLEIPRIKHVLAANAIRWHDFKLLRMQVYGDEEKRLWMNVRYHRTASDVARVEDLLIGSEYSSQTPTPKVLHQLGNTAEDVVTDCDMSHPWTFTYDKYRWIQLQVVREFGAIAHFPELSIEAMNFTTVVFHRRMPYMPYIPLFTSLPIFGFITHSMVHLWDVHHKQVFMLPYALNITDRSFPVSIVPFTEYFACDIQDWGNNLLMFEKLEPPEREPPPPQPYVARAAYQHRVHQQRPINHDLQEMQVVTHKMESTEKKPSDSMFDLGGMTILILLCGGILCVLDFYLTPNQQRN